MTEPEPIKHDFYLDEWGNRDDFRLDLSPHNGPQCLRCHEAFCEHCEPERLDEACDEQTPYLF